MPVQPCTESLSMSSTCSANRDQHSFRRARWRLTSRRTVLPAGPRRPPLAARSTAARAGGGTTHRCGTGSRGSLADRRTWTEGCAGGSRTAPTRTGATGMATTTASGRRTTSRGTMRGRRRNLRTARPRGERAPRARREVLAGGAPANRRNRRGRRTRRTRTCSTRRGSTTRTRRSWISYAGAGRATRCFPAPLASRRSRWIARGTTSGSISTARCSCAT